MAGLPADVAKKYDITGEPGEFITRHPDRVKVDLRRISIQQADELYKKGLLPMLNLKSKKSTSINDAAPDYKKL